MPRPTLRSVHLTSYQPPQGPPDFREVKALLARHVRDFLPLVGCFHDGTPAHDRGNERHTLNPMRTDNNCGSFSANLDTGAWNDRATGEAGSVLDLWAGIRGESLQEACWSAVAAYGIASTAYRQKPLEARLGPSGMKPGKGGKPKGEQWTNTLVDPWKPRWAPAPEGTEPVFYSKAGKPMRPSKVYRYETGAGVLAFAIGRFDREDGKFFMFSYLTVLGQWRNGEPAEFKGKRPVFNLPAVLAEPDLPVVFVEGEKAALAAMRFNSGAVVSTWAGGAGAVGSTDWSSLAGRRVILWPDNDQPGLDAMKAIYRILKAQGCTMFAVQVPEGKPVGWDAADCLEEDPTGRYGALLVLCARRVPK